MALGKRIADALNGRDQKLLTDAIPGLSQQALSNLITRDSKTSEYAMRIADVLGVSIRWLLDGVGSMEDADWPFPGIARSRFDCLGYDEKIEIQGVVRDRIERFEAAESDAATKLAVDTTGPAAVGKAPSPNQVKALAERQAKADRRGVGLTLTAEQKAARRATGTRGKQ